MQLNETDKRLVIRYDNGRAFSFNSLRAGSPDQGVFELAQAFASIQSDEPARISTVTTSRLI